MGLRFSSSDLANTPVVFDPPIPQITGSWTYEADLGVIFERTGIRMDIPTEWTIRASTNQSKHWFWDDPDARPFNADDMCDNVKSILFVGDSLMQHTYLAFVAQMGIVSRVPYPQRIISHTLNHVSACGTKFMYVRNDFMLLNDKPLKYENSNANQPWRHLVDHADILVMNQGAHILSFENFEKNVGRALDFVKNKKVLYLSVPPGYPGCEDHDRPVGSWPDLHNAPHHWDTIPGKNLWVKNIIADNQYPGHHYVNIMDMSMLRADAHVAAQHDCLHFTFPGVYDWWVYVIFNKIIQLF
jgi:hypothetical protein